MSILGSGPVLLGVVFIGFFSITLFLRRWLSSRRSSGPFFAPFHINRGIFYIHVALCFSRRMIPLKEIKQISYLLLRGRAGGGSGEVAEYRRTRLDVRRQSRRQRSGIEGAISNDAETAF